MGAIITNIATVFIIMGVGYLINRVGVLSGKANDYLSPLLIQVTAPCMVFSSISTREVDEGTMGSVLLAILMSALFFIIFSAIGWVICAKILKLGDDENCGVFILLFSSINNGFMGFPITLAVFGEDALFYMAFFQMTLMIFLYGPGILIVHFGDKGKLNIKRMLAALAPNTLASLLGIIVLFTGIKLPALIADPIDIIGDATVSLSMIVIGIQLGNSNFREVIKDRRVIVESALKMIIVPVVTFLLVNWLPISDMLKIVFVFGSAFPSAVAVTPIAAMEGKDAKASAEGVALTTLMSLATLPLAAAVLSALYF